MSDLFSHRSRYVCLLGLLLIGAAAVLLLTKGGAGGTAIAQAPTPAVTETARSQALTASAVPGSLGGTSLLTADGAQTEASQLASTVPLPQGASFGDIIWSDATVLGPISEADVQALVEFNAACKWWSAAYANSSDEVAAQIVRDIPQWPTFRGGDRHATAGSVAAGGEALRNAAIYCDQSARHARTVIAERGRQ